MRYTRRELGQLAMTMVPVAGLLGLHRARGVLAQNGRPNSKIAGVQIGLNVPYNFGGNRTMPGNDVLENVLSLGVSAVELRSQPVEIAMGSPGFAQGAALPGRGATPDQQKAVTAAVRTWRSAAAMDVAREFKRTWDAAGVAIEIVKFDGVYDMSDDEVDFAFRLAKTLGARALSTEIALDDLSKTQRIGRYADKHQLMVGYHGHADTTPEHWERTFAYAKHNGANLDIGHFVAGHNTSPLPFLTRHHDRITHVHIKDRRNKTNGGTNMPFGEGDTPIVEVLRTIRDNKWPIQATIEFEYRVPTGSDRMKEMAKCIEYCRRALTS
jgi:sugar phosphate isomerase/epimerase